MAQIIASNSYIKSIKRLTKSENKRIQTIIKKIIDDPEIGKPLKYRMGERVVRIKPYRLVYYYSRGEDMLYLLRFEHRKKAYE